MQVERISGSRLTAGDTILIGEDMKTVSKADVIGYARDTVSRVLFPKWHCGRIVGFVPQI